VVIFQNSAFNIQDSGVITTIIELWLYYISVIIDS